MVSIPEKIIELVLARHRRRLSEEEDARLEEWVRQDPEHERLLQTMDEYAWSEIYHRIDREKAWQEVDRQTVGLAGWQKVRYVRIWTRVAAIVILLLTVGSGIFLSLWQGEKSLPMTADLPIRAGRPQAELILAGGKRVLLKNDAPQKIVDREGKVVGVDSVDCLVYTSAHSTEAEWNTLDIPQGGEYRLVLPDGTKVWLNSDSKLRFPSHFLNKERRVELQGEAFFEVARDTLHPFRVETAHVVVQVLGTSFNVSCYPDEEVEQTTLVEGRVEVMIDGQTAELQPGRQLQLNVNTQEIEVREVDVALFSSWKDGLFRFSDMPLEELVMKLERWYQVNFFFLQADCREVRFTGAIRKYANLQEFIRLIETTTDVKFNIKENTITIQKK